MKSHTKKLIVSILLMIVGFYVFTNSYGWTRPLKEYIGDYGVIPFILLLLFGGWLIFFGVMLLVQVLITKVGNNPSIGETLSEKVFEVLLPIMKRWDRFIEWLNKDGSKK